MLDRPRLPKLLTALICCLPLWASAQTSTPLSAAERAQREADRVFDVIKFHTIRSKPAVEAPPKPRPVAAPAPRAAPAARPPQEALGAAALAPEPAEPRTAALTPVAESGSFTATALPAPAAALPALATPVEAGAIPAREVEPEAEDPAEAPLRMQSFVAPVLSPAVQATLGVGVRQIRVRLTVEPDGRVSQAEAAAGVPRRLAKPATDAILQWRFEPLAQARTADVEISFRRD